MEDKPYFYDKINFALKHDFDLSELEKKAEEFRMKMRAKEEEK